MIILCYWSQTTKLKNNYMHAYDCEKKIEKIKYFVKILKSNLII